jgi:DNA polymerase III alpha subunit
MKKFKYSCGCSFDLEEKDDKKYINFNPDINSINLECEKTWDLISSGNTKGIFQLESRLGRSIAKKLKPQNIEQLSALISILRPGSLEAYRDGKTITQHYIDRKNGLESIDYFHPSLKPILEKSLGELIYQEQAMKIATDIAGFSLQESDELRKAIGKKLADKMAKVKKKFLEGSEKLNIVNKAEAEEIFGWIEKAQRYSFNKSVTKETVVITENENKTIEELNIGEKILAPTNNGNEYVEVINKYDHGEQEVFKITLENSSQITCTMEHKFLCSDNKIYPLSEILLNHLAVVCLSDIKNNKIVKIEKVGIKPTVDIEVKSNNHLFFGNGIATSNSHAVSYAMNAYLSAYTKAHFPKIFFASYLKFAKDKIDPQDEIKSLVQNANEMDIIIHTPDLRILNQYFVLKDNKIYFGLTDIKGFGESIYNKILLLLKNKNINLYSCEWLELLDKILLNINSIGAKALIESGALSFINKTRNSMLFELNIASKLTTKELSYINDSKLKFKHLNDALKYVLDYGKINKNRKKIIEDLLILIKHPPYSLEDTPEWIADSEDRTLGCSITCSKIDMYDISMTNTTCRDFKNGTKKDNIIIGGEIDYINVTKTKTGKNKGAEMCFVNLIDQTGSLDNVIFFPEQYKKYKNLLFSGNIVILVGNKSKAGDGLIVEKAYIAKT